MADAKPQATVVLLVSGGPDSATLAKMVAERRPETKVNAIYLRTGHPSDEKEIEAANQIIAEIGGRLEIIDISNTVAAAWCQASAYPLSGCHHALWKCDSVVNCGGVRVGN